MSSEDELRQPFYDLIHAFSDRFEDGDLVYHYTSAEGLRGIIESGEIWLTNTAFVNDTTECRAFWDLERKDVLGTDPFPNEYLEEWWNRYRRTRREDNSYYIASFSKAPELLQQFRAYGSFCIGFDASRLAKTGFYLYDCVYDASDVRDWIRNRAAIKKWDDLEGDWKDGAASILFFNASIKYKNEHYKAEQEVRLFSVSNADLTDLNVRQATEKRQPPIHFRDHRAHRLPVPYVSFFLTDGASADSKPDLASETPIDTRTRRLAEERGEPRRLLPITEVRIGPMAHQQEARIACEVLLKTRGYDHVKVDVSDIPYRGL